MNKPFYPVIALLVLALVAMACALPGGVGNQPAPSGDQVATLVASTLQALTPAPGAGSTSTPEVEAQSVLPHTFYYLGTDSVGLTQVFRIEKDGKTQKQITAESVNVGNYDVSPVDGSVAYVVNNQLLLINADGSGRRMLVDGGPTDPDNQMASSISNPTFSPNGQTIAYGYKGLILYSVSSGASNLVLPQKPAGDTTPPEMYFPKN